jgi:uncharacterized Zn finger protein
MSFYGGWNEWAPRPTVGERKAAAEKEIAKLRKKGLTPAPVVLEGRTIASTFWGKAWCRNLERYSDISNRLERGRSYVRSGSVVDLQITPGRVAALVRGTSLYKVTITLKPVERARYQAIVGECAGKIDSMVELLQGKLSGAVMEVITDVDRGLFPAPRQIGMDCSCPDGATMCKHVAAVLYGIGARFDQDPKLLFQLRGAEPAELVSSAAAGTLLGARPVAREKKLRGDLAGVFGIELDEGPAPIEAAEVAVAAKRARVKGAPVKSAPARKTTGKKTAPKPVTITGAELSDLGVPPPTVQFWLRTGVLGRTETRGLYLRTDRTDERLARHAQRRANG